MPFVPASLDLEYRISLGLQSSIQSVICPLIDPNNAANTLPASQVYAQDWPIPETGVQYPAIVISIEGERMADSKVMTFFTDGHIYPNVLRLVDRRDTWDQAFQPAWTLWRKTISDFLRTLGTLPGCTEVWNVWTEERAVYAEDAKAVEYVTSEILVQTHAYYPRSH
jgi:hypothetical protein